MSLRALCITTPLLLLASIVMAQEIPRPAPDLTINYPDGHTKQLADYHGKVVVLVFISVTCPHCQHTTGVLTRLQNELGARGVQVLEVALDNDAKSSVPGFVSQFHPSFPVGFTADYPAVVRVLTLPNNQRPLYPMMVMIDRSGVIQFEATGRDNILSNEAEQEQSLKAEILKILHEAGHGSRSH